MGVREGGGGGRWGQNGGRRRIHEEPGAIRKKKRVKKNLSAKGENGEDERSSSAEPFAALLARYQPGRMNSSSHYNPEPIIATRDSFSSPTDSTVPTDEEINQSPLPLRPGDLKTD